MEKKTIDYIASKWREKHIFLLLQKEKNGDWQVVRQPLRRQPSFVMRFSEDNVLF